MSYVNVAIPSPLATAFTYAVPETMSVAVGMRVLAPFRRRPTVGLILETITTLPAGLDPQKVLPLLEPLDDTPAIHAPLLKLLRWMSEYYCTPIGEVARAALPPRMWSPTAPRTTRPCTPHELLPQTDDRCLVLNAAQTSALHDLVSASREQKPSVHVLHGVTGSGKTEVYLQLFEALASDGKQGILLVPEIGLTSQLTGRAQARFGDRVAVYHSALTDAQRHAQWERIRKEQVDVVIGTRSALFAPVPKLGAIVVDEEHDASFKQDEGFTYHGRDSAIMRAHIEGAIAVLGSATPSIESLANAQSEKYKLHRLPERATANTLPTVEIVDLCNKRKQKREQPSPETPLGLHSLSPELYRAITETLARREQVLLFLGKRGFASALHCEACGEVFTCPNCDIALTAHMSNKGIDARGSLTCHYCDYRIPMPSSCCTCKSEELDLIGHGTQRLEAELADFFPNARVARLDSDVIESNRERQEVLTGMRRGEFDILVGTQMVTKGHDFPEITLVGVISADLHLHMPDFRAAERTFQMLTQVAGRAGRGSKPGRVLIQTYQPNHPSIMAAIHHDGEGFAQQELEFRRALGYPPFSRLANVRISAIAPAVAEKAARDIAALIRKHAPAPIQILGPAPSPLARIRGRHRWQILIKAPSSSQLASLITRARPLLERATPRTVRWAMDVDPVNLL